MNVVILTQPLGHNYGGLLQAYALQAYLRKIGCDVETLDRRFEEPKRFSNESRRLKLSKIRLRSIKSFLIRSHRARQLENLVKFRKERLVMSPPISSEREIRDYFKGRKVDLFVVGSDQVWRPLYSPSILNFYLDFLDDVKSTAGRITYAASFGVDHWEYSTELTDKCRVLANKFDAISVRESSAVKLCLEKLGEKVQLVLDPTMLINPDEYKLLFCEHNLDERIEGVVSYMLDFTMEKKNITELVGKILEKKVSFIKADLNQSIKLHDMLSRRQFPSVEIWLKSFHKASFIVTDSFHGAIFSILFNKPFVVIGNSARGMARFDSLLSQFGLEERLVETEADVTPRLIQDKIDWVKVNEIRELLASASRNYLEKCISIYK